MTLDKKALDVATETLRPLFREPVSYLEQAAREVIAAYLTAAPPARVEALEKALKECADVLDVFGDAADCLISPELWRQHDAEGAISRARAALSPEAT
jgi:hypothetical protein